MKRHYNDYKTYLKNKYGCSVYKIGVDAGFSCPNRDGTKGRDGCLYCNAGGSRSAYANPRKSVHDQLADRIELLKRRDASARFIAYFQAFTNTYASPSDLKKIYDGALGFDDVVGLSIGTRPDAVDDDKMKLISSYSGRYDVWLELGLQSMHNKTLDRINRGHSFEDFVAATILAGKYALPVCAHIILGLPGETKEEMIKTARVLDELKIDAVKIHLLHILKGSPMEKIYNSGGIALMPQAEYVELVCDILENLSPRIVIQRLTGEGHGDDHVAPDWATDKAGTINRIEETLSRRGTSQGWALRQEAIS